MKRILQIGMTDNLGGIETFIMNYYRNINKKKYQFDFINIYNNELCFQNELEEMGAKVYKISSYYKHPIKYMRELIDIIKKNKYEVVHCNMNSAVFLYPLIAAKIAKSKVIIAHSHNSSSDKGFLKSFLHFINKHFIPFFATNFFACSNKAGEWFFYKNVLKSKKFKIINNAIDVSSFIYNDDIRYKKRKELDIGKNTIVLGHVGRFNKQKNHDFLIDVFNEYYKINNDSKLILIGIGPLFNSIQEKVKKLNLTKSVVFLGQRNDVNELMQAMDIFVLPSLYEGLGTVLIEAQAADLMCVASSEVPASAKVTDNFSFCKLNNIKEWESILLKFKSNKRKNTINDINDNSYNILIETKKLEDLYKCLLKENE